jgi:hypothetical protein
VNVVFKGAFYACIYSRCIPVQVAGLTRGFLKNMAIIMKGAKYNRSIYWKLASTSTIPARATAGGTNILWLRSAASASVSPGSSRAGFDLA